MAEAKRKKLSLQQTRKMVPAVKEFNAVAKFFLRILGKKIAEKEKKIARITIMVNKMTIPQNKTNISIQTIDINNTQIKKTGQYSFNRKMDWEQDFRNKKRGIML